MFQKKHPNRIWYKIWYFSATTGSRNSILDIFQLPFPCRFEKYPLFYHLVKSRLRYLQITTGRSFQKLTFLFFVESNTWAVMSTIEQPLALMSSSKHLWALRSSSDYVAMFSGVLLSAHECSWVLSVPRHQPHECVWFEMIAYDFPIIICKYLSLGFTKY